MNSVLLTNWSYRHWSYRHATLELAMSVGLLVCWFVTFLICERFRHFCPCQTKCECILCYTAPAHPSATGGECIRPRFFFSLIPIFDSLVYSFMAHLPWHIFALLHMPSTKMQTSWLNSSVWTYKNLNSGGRDFALVAEIHTVPLYLLCSCTINAFHFISFTKHDLKHIIFLCISKLQLKKKPFSSMKQISFLFTVLLSSFLNLLFFFAFPHLIYSI